MADKEVLISGAVCNAPAGMALPRSISVQKSGLLFRDKPSLRSWEEAGRHLFSLANSSTWWIADWLVYGERVFKDRYLEVAGRTGLEYQTLRNYVWVARRFERERRRDSLSFGHHAEVAALDQPEQDYWLRKAEDLGWSRNELRRQVRASLRERNDLAVEPCGGEEGGEGEADLRNDGGSTVPASVNMTLSLALTGDQIKLFERTAGTHNMELREWALTVLESAARTSR